MPVSGMKPVSGLYEPCVR